MISYLRDKIAGFWNNGHERTLKIKKNIVYSFLIKGGSVLIGYLLFPLTLHYVNPSQYGIWLTISSLVAWMNTFDIGLSNGLRNKMAHSLALGEKEEIAKYVSTTYALLGLIAIATFVVFFIAGSFFNWNQLLNVQNAVDYNIWPIVVVALGAFCIQFALQPINSVLIASHEPFKASLILLISQLLTIIIIYVLTVSTQGNLLTLVIAVTGAPILVFIMANVYYFMTDLRSFAPRFKFIDLKSARSLLNVGSVFFFIQIGALILYETDNIVITRVLGPNEVTTFNTAFKYFSILSVAFAIIMTPYWSAFTDAYAKQDFEWIKHALQKMRKLWLYLSVLAVVLYFFAAMFYKLWVGETVVVPKALSVSIAIYMMVQSWQVIHAYLLNGVGKLRIQLILLIVTSIVNIPLSVFLIRKVGLHGTVIANIIVMVIMDLIFTYQCKLIVEQKAKGIWDK